MSHDAWACGVVLYALTTRCLPFDSLHVHGGLNSKGRKGMLLRIAKCEYSWPQVTAERLTLWQILGVKEDRGETPCPEPTAAMEA